MNAQEKENLKGAGHWIAVAQLAGFEFDMELDPHVLTDKSNTKALPCRVCKRPCVVTQFASAAKTACLDHRDRHAPTTVVHDLKAGLEPHILTDKDETKNVPCRHCGRPCVVTRFASAAKVACLDCRKTAPRPRKTTEYKDNGDGRMVAETRTEIMSEHDLQWSEWTIAQPWQFDNLWDGDEKERHTTVKKAGFDARIQIKTCKRAIRAKEQELNGISPTPKNDVKIQKLEEEIDSLTSEEMTLSEVVSATQAEASRLSRIAYCRGALSAGYKIVKRDGRRHMIGRERDIVIPHDFLEPGDYKIAESTVPAGV